MNTTFTHSKELNGPVLVTGAGGCIGSWVAALLVKENIPVVAFDLSQDTHFSSLFIPRQPFLFFIYLKTPIPVFDLSQANHFSF